MSILCWNCQGAGSTETVQTIREVRRKFFPDIMFLMETKQQFGYISWLQKSLGVTTNLLDAYPPCSSVLERPLRATYQGRSRPERPAQSDYLKSLQPERPAQVTRVLTGRDTKRRVWSDLLQAQKGSNSDLTDIVLC
ncbi:hypothetical protein F2Q68_00021033 [Brassica cretica]|uniref:Endonuclease/exonuclease/phosphatase domain-containing protein n=1 Tax=Brassica cretica TaxID=69181 RepID=A0A8S9FU87_BRACR|nr:hypothetical protein F2Q68_00021033 [Brassica cretica]